MSLSIRPARRSEAKPLIGLYDLSGNGKTLSALLLARGFVGQAGKVVMIESESGRGEAHMDTVIECAQHKGAFSRTCPLCSYVGGFDVVPLRDDFSPKTYGNAISLAEEQGAQALIVDSSSHEWEGVGGVLHMAEMKRQDKAQGMQVWTQAKIDHQRHFIGRLLQTPIPLVILCMRAKVPMEEYTDEKGKKQMRRSDMLVPKQSSDILFEMFVHGHFDEKHNFHGTKYTKPELAAVLPSGKAFTNATGAALARWAAGGDAKPVTSTEVPVASLAAIVAAIKVAETIEQLQQVGMRAKGLPEGDKAAAQFAYKERLERMKGVTATAKDDGREFGVED